MLKLKLQYCGHLIWRADSFEETQMLGKIEGRGEGDDRGWDGWMASLTQWTWVWVNSGSWLWTGRPDVLWFMGSQRVGLDWATELNWTEGDSMLFFLVAVPLYIPTNSVGGFPPLHTLSSIYCLWIFFKITILVGVKWNLIVDYVASFDTVKLHGLFVIFGD